jgi:hypothetical protein
MGRHTPTPAFVEQSSIRFASSTVQTGKWSIAHLPLYVHCQSWAPDLHMRAAS